MAVSSSVAVPHSELRLLLSAEPTGRDGREEEQLAIPRPLQFVTDALIMKDLSTDLIIGWPTLKGTGLLAIVLGLEEYELEEDKDDDGLGELWEALPFLQCHLERKERVWAATVEHESILTLYAYFCKHSLEPL